MCLLFFGILLHRVCFYPLGQPCKVMITGNPQNVAMAVQMVTDLINSNGSGGGGHGGPAGGTVLQLLPVVCLFVNIL